jgi:hypothetical protein
MLQLACDSFAIVDRDRLGRWGQVVNEHTQQATGALFSVDQVVTQACHGVFNGALPVHQKRVQPCRKNKSAKKNGLEESAQSFDVAT